MANLEEAGQVVFRYVDAMARLDGATNVNGSARAIAGGTARPAATS
jgi:phosphoribosylformylglycinamidine (FGAM) synthase-like amidotransferase family enzyme